MHSKYQSIALSKHKQRQAEDIAILRQQVERLKEELEKEIRAKEAYKRLWQQSEAIILRGLWRE